MQNREMNTNAAVSLERPPTGPEEQRSTLPQHLMHLPGGPWAVWRTVALRGAGFPAADVYRLATPAAALAADRLIEAEDEEARMRSDALTLLRRDIEAADGEKLAALKKALSRVKKGKPTVERGVMNTETITALSAYQQASLRSAEARSAHVRTYQEQVAHLSQAIQEVARTERFREAVTWQNRHALHGSIEALLRMTPGENIRGTDRRKREELVANYLQRYCIKNDTIGFFGPLGWAKLMPEGEAIRVPAETTFLAARNVRFEAWCIDALAESLAHDRVLKPWAAPRRGPFIYLENTLLHLPFKRPIKIPLTLAEVIKACDGEKTGKQIAHELLQNPALKLRSAEDVYRILEALHTRELIQWSFTVPVPYKLNPEEGFRRLCEGIEVEELRRPILDALDKMESARRAVARAAGDAESLDGALKHLEETFTSLTGQAPTRAAGEMYASRTLVYEDCRRAPEIEIGPQILQSLGPPLSLLLTSARWLTSEIAARYRKAFEEIHADLSQKARSPVIDAANFWLRVHPLLYDEKAKLTSDALAGFHQRWTNILNFDPQQSRMHYNSEDLWPQVQAAFHVPRAGWSYARYNSPDVMIAASSTEAIRRGDYQFVLGEMHAAEVTVANWVFVGQHPAPDELFQCLESDLPEPRVVPIAPKYQPGLTVRTSPALLSSKDYFLEYAFEPSDVPSARSLPISQLVIEKRDDKLLFRTRDGRLQFDPIEFMGTPMTNLVINTLKIVPASYHAPRITIDRLVVSRESWTFSPSAIGFVQEKDDSARFMAARRWARAHGIPRLVFVKTPVEMKPFFVDFDSPIYVSNFVRIIRRSAAAAESDVPTLRNCLITLSEMLPTPEQTWLPDAQDRHCTSEFRMVTLDLIK
jgi:hypothetical protein